MRVKVCGMTKPEQVQELDELGVDFAGFIFYPRSPRYVFKSMPCEQIKKIKGNINKVGVFVNASVDEVLKSVDDCGLHLVQLHGDESPKTCEKIAEYISVIKAFRMGENDNIEWKLKDYYDAVDMFMFDTLPPVIQTEKGAESYGGSGRKFNWQLLEKAQINKLFFLSGGIAPEDAEAVRSFAKLPVAKNMFSIDINSRFEQYPGIKDMEKIKSFLNELRK